MKAKVSDGWGIVLDVCGGKLERLSINVRRNSCGWR